jgi:amino acid transporter
MVKTLWVVLQTLADRMLGAMNFVIPLGVALSTFGCALSIQFSVTRLCYVAGREGHMLQALSYIHTRRLTPAPAVLLQVSSSQSHGHESRGNQESLCWRGPATN